MADLEQLNSIFADLADDAKRLTKQNADLAQENTTLAARRHYLYGEIDYLLKRQETLADSHTDVVEIQATAIQNLETKQWELQTAIQNLENLRQQAETDLQLMQTTSDKEIAKLGELLRAKHQELTDVQRTITVAHKEFDDLQALLHAHTTAIASLDTERANKQVEMTETLAAYNDDLQQTQRKLEKITKDYDAAIKQYADSNEKIAVAEKKHALLVKEKDEFETKKQTVTKMLEAKDKSLTEREEALQVAVRRAKNQGILDKV